MEQPDSALERARAHVKSVRDFLYHLMVFLFVNGLLVILDVRAGTDDQAVLGLDWAYWLVLFWGLGVVGHAVSLFQGERAVQRAHARERKKELTGR